jgi:translation initiation factor IF-3
VRLADDFAELGSIEQRPNLDGRNMTMMLAPARARQNGAGAAKGSDGAAPADGSAADAVAGDAPAPATTPS